jgi:lipopolysaccharide export system permease protein
MFATSLLGRYLFGRVLIAMATALGGILVTIVLVDVVEQFRTVGTAADLSLPGALYLTGLKVPLLVEQTTPFAMLVAGMAGYLSLARRSELSAIRASGVSAWRFLTPLAVLGLALGLVLAILVNPFGAAMNEDFERQRDRITGTADVPRSGSDIWLRQGDGNVQSLILARSLSGGGAQLGDVTFFQFEVGLNGASRFARRIDAETATLTDGFWQLENVVENEAAPAPAPTPNAGTDAPAPPSPPVSLPAPSVKPNLALPTTLTREDLLERVVDPNSLSFWQLPGFIAEARAAGLQPTRHEFRFYSLLALPLTITAMGLIGALFSLRLARSGGTPVMIAAGLLSGFVFFFTTRLAEAMASSALTPPLVAAFAPAMAALFAAAAAIAAFEDG